MCTERWSCVRWLLQVPKRPQKDQTCRQLYLGLLVYRTMRKSISVVWATQSMVFCYGSPSKLIQMGSGRRQLHQSGTEGEHLWQQCRDPRGREGCSRTERPRRARETPEGVRDPGGREGHSRTETTEPETGIWRRGRWRVEMYSARWAGWQEIYKVKYIF